MIHPISSDIACTLYHPSVLPPPVVLPLLFQSNLSCDRPPSRTSRTPPAHTIQPPSLPQTLCPLLRVHLCVAASAHLDHSILGGGLPLPSPNLPRRRPLSRSRSKSLHGGRRPNPGVAVRGERVRGQGRRVLRDGAGWPLGAAGGRRRCGRLQPLRRGRARGGRGGRVRH